MLEGILFIQRSELIFLGNMLLEKNERVLVVARDTLDTGIRITDIRCAAESNCC